MSRQQAIYARGKDAAASLPYLHAMAKEWGGPESFVEFTDGPAGQRGLKKLAAAIASGRIHRIFVSELADLARSLPALARMIRDMRAADCHIVLVGDEIATHEADIGKALDAFVRAHYVYSGANRKAGMERARADGASIGRPSIITSEVIRGTISALMLTKTKRRDAGNLPSVRELAKAAHISVGTAAAALNEFRMRGDVLRVIQQETRQGGTLQKR